MIRIKFRTAPHDLAEFNLVTPQRPGMLRAGQVFVDPHSYRSPLTWYVIRFCGLGLGTPTALAAAMPAHKICMQRYQYRANNRRVYCRWHIFTRATVMKWLRMSREPWGYFVFWHRIANEPHQTCRSLFDVYTRRQGLQHPAAAVRDWCLLWRTLPPDWERNIGIEYCPANELYPPPHGELLPPVGGIGGDW